MSTPSAQLTLAGLSDAIGWELLSLDEDRRSNRCTAACLDARTELRDGIIRALAKGQGTATAAAAFGVSREVVRALKRKILETGELDAHKQLLGREATHALDLLLERVRDDVDKVPASSFAPLMTSLVNAAQLLTGGPTSRVAQTKEGAGVADLAAFIDSLPRAEPVAAGEMSSLEATSDPVIEAGGEQGAEAVEVSAGDSVSPDLRAATEEIAS